MPEYARPLEGNFGRGIRTGVGEALIQFVALIRDPDAGRGPGREVYVGLGRGEQRQGRTLDSLQAAYRIGARVAWRRSPAPAAEAELDAEVLSLLAEAIFAYIDELSADSVDGYAGRPVRESRTCAAAADTSSSSLLMREPAARPRTFVPPRGPPAGRCRDGSRLLACAERRPRRDRAPATGRGAEHELRRARLSAGARPRRSRPGRGN